jgi:hypothetical protein
MEDSSNVQAVLDTINNELLQIQTDITNIETEEIITFVDFKDSNYITYYKGNKSNDIEFGGYIIRTDRNSQN